MRRLAWLVLVSSLCSLGASCNQSAPEPAAVDLPSAKLRLTIVRMATDLFLQRFNLTLKVQGETGCSTSTDLFPDTGYTGRRNVYLAGKGMIYVVGQFDARVIDPQTCQATLSEFRHLDRQVVFLGSFDMDSEKRWTYFPASQRPELGFEKR
ncbi:MAG: hypothetical protein FJ247_10570 [Nitrospira sp.]|nr:hypothetical protein [Nitrospira sp.]